VRKIKLEDKVNEIGKMVCDIKFSIHIIENKVNLIKEFMINEDKLKFEREWRKSLGKKR